MNKKDRKIIRAIIERIDKNVFDKKITKDLNLLRAIILIDEEKGKYKSSKSKLKPLHKGLKKYLEQKEKKKQTRKKKNG